MAQAYGLPYTGSKNGIVRDMFNAIPSAENFYDLFCGGGAVTHYALTTNKYKNLYASDLNKNIPELLSECLRGECKDIYRWVTREEFLAEKDTNAYVSTCWSFGNNRREYLYSKEIETWKKAIFLARTFGDNSMLKSFDIDSDGSSKDILKNLAEYQKKYQQWYMKHINVTQEELDLLKRLPKGEVNLWGTAGRKLLRQRLLSVGVDISDKETLNRLLSIERLTRRDKSNQADCSAYLNSEATTRIKRILSLKTATRTSYSVKGGISYNEVEIRPDSVVYCDIPYRNTDKKIYNPKRKKELNFNYDKFYKWAEDTAKENIVLISEYSMPEDRFVSAWSKKKAVLLNNYNKVGEEKLYVPKVCHERYLQAMRKAEVGTQRQLVFAQQ